MTALILLRDLREIGVIVQAQAGDVLVLTTPAGVRLELLIGTGEFEQLYVLVQEFDAYLALLTDCARMPRCEAEACAWQLLLAGYLPIGDD